MKTTEVRSSRESTDVCDTKQGGTQDICPTMETVRPLCSDLSYATTHPGRSAKHKNSSFTTNCPHEMLMSSFASLTD